MSFGSRSLPPPTADERRRIEAMKERGCLITGEVGEIHHLLIGGIRAGHRYSICLSPWLHRGVAKNGALTRRDSPMFHAMRLNYGPSLYHEARAFHARYGSDQHLLNLQDDAVDWPRIELPTKRIRAKSPARRPAKAFHREQT